MKTRMTAAAVLGMAIATVVGCNKPRDPGVTTTTSSETTIPANPTANPATTPTKPDVLVDSDKDFITKATEGGMLEVSLGSQAAQKGVTPDIKSFGSQMMADHQKANDDLKALATKKGVDVPIRLDDDHQKKVDELGRLSGKKFDDKYAKDMVSDHEEDVKEFQDASKDLKDPDLRAWAANTLPTLQHHLQMAKDMKAKESKTK